MTPPVSIVRVFCNGGRAALSVAMSKAGVSMAVVLVAGLGACRDEAGSAPDRESTETARPPLFVDVAAETGLAFVHDNGATGQFLFPELMGAGCAFLDYDNDSFLDIYLVQSGPLPVEPGTDREGNRLFRNRGDGTFEDVTASTRVGDPGYGCGVAVADYDRDGDVDIYVTNYGRNALHRNNGDGTFTDVTEAAGVGDTGYSMSAAFVDYDADGNLDLYVCNYLDWTPQIERLCRAPSGVRDYCSPMVYHRPQADTLYRNNGDGTFTDVSARAGIGATAATGLGVTWADFSGDGRVDIYVANDLMRNNLWINNGDGTFTDDALARACALNETGQAEAGMGVATEDADDDGDWDLFMVHLDSQTNTFYQNAGEYFQDVTNRLRLGVPSQPFTGFGTGLFDYDCDGAFDIFVANGGVRISQRPGTHPYAQRNQLFHGQSDDTFAEVVAKEGPALGLLEVSRGAAFGDYDNDGDVDVLVTNNNGPVRLLRNDTPAGHHWITVQLVGRTIDRDAIGARVTIQTAGRTRRRIVQPAYSYASSNDPRVYFGLGSADRIDVLTIRWPDGQTEERKDVPADQLLRIEQPRSSGPSAGKGGGG